MLERLPLLAGLTLLALAVALGSVFIANGIRDRNRNDVLTVTGSAKQRIVSDYVVWRSSVTSEQSTAAAAERQLRVWTVRARRFFATQGAREGELTLQPVSTVPPGSTDEEGNEVTGYRLTREFEVRSSRVSAIAAVAERSSSLLAAGVPLAAEAPEYSYNNLNSLRPRLLAAAMRDAERRARVIVDASDAELGHLRGVDVGVFQVPAPNSTEVSDYGEYDTSTLRKDVAAVVNVTFALSG